MIKKLLFIPLLILSVQVCLGQKGKFGLHAGTHFTYPKAVINAFLSSEDDEDDLGDDEVNESLFMYGGISLSLSPEYFLEDSLSIVATLSVYPRFTYAKGDDVRKGLLKSYSLDVRKYGYHDQVLGYFSAGVSYVTLTNPAYNQNRSRYGINAAIGVTFKNQPRLITEFKIQTAQILVGMNFTYRLTK